MTEAQKPHQFPCQQCGAELTFAPGKEALDCVYCGFSNPIEGIKGEVVEHDYHQVLAQRARISDQVQDRVVKCGMCAAEFEVTAHQTSDRCAYCDTPIVVEATNKNLIPASHLVPFVIDVRRAREQFRAWLKTRWFAPNSFKKQARQDAALKGMYAPYWTYDSDTYSDYKGMRGDDYYVTETYTTTENGRSVTRTRQVRRTRWTSVSGRVYNTFDDVLVLGSHSLPKRYADALEPWDLGQLTKYEDSYVSGFGCEVYQVNLEQGFEEATKIMDAHIRQSVCRDIGGDHQRITWLHTEYNDITFKHILLPIWVSAYRYRRKVWTFLVNGQTGEVQGERPYSWIKITALSVTVAAIVGTLIWYFNQ
ncbi:MAG: hypothetical protein KDC35_14480 [Acidobacteria bacterium]|nr:hypothetical protein [Acidobacteriota bacterium]